MKQLNEFIWDEPTAISSLEGIVSEGCIAELCDSGLFVVTAIKAARGTQSSHRRKILIDLAGVLSCDASELDFMFVDPVIAANDSDPVEMPDYRTELMAVAL